VVCIVAARAQILADDLAKRIPEETIVQFSYLPTLRAQLTLSRNDSSMALGAIKAAAPYEMGTPCNCGFSPALYPVYVRGEAYLAGHQGEGRQAVTEFQKIIAQRGVVHNEPIGALAHLGLARVYAQTGETEKSLAAYRELLAFWKNADPDLRLLKEAKAEYSKLSEKAKSSP
jgi:eukaryotic-like serine/threonine-protein kinase